MRGGAFEQPCFLLIHCDMRQFFASIGTRLFFGDNRVGCQAELPFASRLNALQEGIILSSLPRRIRHAVLTCQTGKVRLIRAANKQVCPAIQHIDAPEAPLSLPRKRCFHCAVDFLRIDQCNHRMPVLGIQLNSA